MSLTAEQYRQPESAQKFLAEREGVISNSLFEELLDWEAQLQCLYEDYPEHVHKPFGPPDDERDGPDLDGGPA